MQPDPNRLQFVSPFIWSFLKGKCNALSPPFNLQDAKMLWLLLIFAFNIIILLV